MLVKRTITGVVFGLFVVAGICYLPAFGFNLLAVLVVSLAFWEYTGFFAKYDRRKRIWFLAMFLLVFGATRFFSKLPILIVGGMWWLVVPYFLWLYTVNKNKLFNSTRWQWLVGIMVFIPCLVGLIEIREMFGAMFLLYLLAIVCATDIGAYFTGVLWGKHLLAPQVSPKKTFEGLIGGLLFSLFVTVIGALLLMFGFVNVSGIAFYFSSIHGFSLLILAMITCLWSVIGDLFESMLKRQTGIKDSGLILPGHGGMYDRIDSLTAAIPIFVLGLYLM